MKSLRRPHLQCLHAVLLVPAVGATGAFAQARPEAPPLSFDAARARMVEYSDKLAAARSAVESKELQSEGLKRLGRPVVSVSGWPTPTTPT